MNFLNGKLRAASRQLKRIKRELVPVSINLDHKILVGTHHKTGTVWMGSILRPIAKHCKLSFGRLHTKTDASQWQMCLNGHSAFDLENIPTRYRGVHIVRDPRDIIVSGCFYHQRSREPWLHRKYDQYGGLTYQEKINSFSTFDDKLEFEMENSSHHGISEILRWDYENPNFLEVKFEDLMADTNLMLFHKIFCWLELPSSVLPYALSVAYDNSLFSGKVRTSGHVRSGKASQWSKFFTKRHKLKFLEIYGNALVKLGYEQDDSWVES